MAVMGVILCLSATVRSQTLADSAIKFYANGGSYCFRVAPAGVALGSETEWTVIVLTSKSNPKSRFQIRDVDEGRTRLTKGELATAGEIVTAVWRFDRGREEFFEKFADGIRQGLLRARLVRTGPPDLGRMPSDRDRTNVYLKFAEKGSSVSFEKAQDLTPDEFMAYLEYFPD